MKKLLTLFVFTLAMFTLIGKVNAGYSYTVPVKDTTYSGEGTKFMAAVTTDSVYPQGTLINIILTEESGIIRHTVENNFNTTYFEVAEAEAPIPNTSGYYKMVLRTKTDLPAGSYTLINFVSYHDPASLDDCLMRFSLAIDETPKTCLDSIPSSGIYYNDSGERVDLDTYYYECNPHVCEVVTVGTNKHYFNKDGIEVATKEEMITSCDCQSDGNGSYYKWNEETQSIEFIDENQYTFECTPRACTSYDYNNKTYYYDINGDLVNTEEEMLKSCQCRYDAISGKYYDNENKEITADEFKEKCECRIEDGKDTKEYYCKKGEPCTADEYKNQCPENSPTGSTIPYIAIIGGVILAGGCYLVTRRHSKIKNI